jgi:transposase
MPPRPRFSVLKKQRDFYSGKKKSHTLKSQILIDQRTGQILATAFASGKTTDINLLRQSRIRLACHIKGVGDSGYQGLYRLFVLSQTPHKKPPKGELTPQQKRDNRQLSRLRLKVEHLFCRLKVFKILCYRYRNHRQRFALRCNLIAALVNRDLPKHL